MNLDLLLSHWGFTRDDILVAMVMLTTLVISVLVWQTLLVRDRIGPRMRLLAHRRAAMKEEYLAGDGEPDSEVVNWMRRIVQRLKLLHGRNAQKAAMKLLQAGLRGNREKASEKSRRAADLVRLWRPPQIGSDKRRLAR